MNRAFWIPIILYLLLFLISCSQQTRHKTLSLFFDGVPDPDNAQAVTDSAKSHSNDDESDTVAKAVIYIHDAYSRDSCGDCHDKAMGNALVTAMPELCYDCHDDFNDTYEKLHEPVDAGNCTDCHNPHKAKNKSLLILAPEKLCIDCHDIEDVRENEEHADVEASDCMDCHNPHGGDEYLM